jgi:tight adherence protein B
VELVNPLVLLAGVGVMIALTGLVLGTAGIAGVGTSRPRRSGRRLVVRRSWLGGAVVGVLVLLVTGWVAVAAGAAGACVIVPAILASGGEADARIARLEGLAGFTRRLADLLASGAVGSLDQALRRAAAGCPPAIHPQVAALVSRMGPQGLEPALRAFGRDLADPAGDHVAMALILRARNGGRGLATVLQNLATDVDDQVRMRRQIKAELAKPMNSIRGLVILTVGVWILSAVFLRQYMAPYSTPGGQVALLVIVAVFALGMAWLRRLTRPVVGARFLVDPGAPARISS